MKVSSIHQSRPVSLQRHQVRYEACTLPFSMRERSRLFDNSLATSSTPTDCAQAPSGRGHARQFRTSLQVGTVTVRRRPRALS